MASNIEKLAIVIVTYKRDDLLDALLDSLLFLKDDPWRVYVIDNDNSSETRSIVELYARLAGEGATEVAWSAGEDSFVYVPMLENTGGAGGFSEGVKRAYADGAEWFWLMDDDVEAAPEAISLLSKWTSKFDAIQGSRLDFDGGSFYWQYRFFERLGMYDPMASSSSSAEGWRQANALCFEGALFNRKIVETLGPPDGRFFLYWDDCVYGYLASKFARVALVDDVILKRSREVSHREIGSARQLNSFSDMTRYHVMRNRGLMGNYMKIAGDYSPVPFALGTVLVAAKELVRLAVVDRDKIVTGLPALYSGWREANRILHDREWVPVTAEDLPTDADR